MFSLLLLALALSLDEPPKKSDYPNGKILIEPAELAERIKAGENLVILDCRPAEERQKGWIVDATHVDCAKWDRILSRSAFTDELREEMIHHGLRSTGSRVILYDHNRSKDAARIWWILRRWGFTNLQLLNGGWNGWISAKLPVGQSYVVIQGSFQLPKRPTEPNVLAQKADLIEILKSNSSGTLTIDARSDDEFCGKANTAKRNGAIPGSKHLEWSELLDKDTHRFRSPEELKKLFDEAGIDLNKPLITYCQSGGRASVMAFGLELMGAKNVKNYYASWAEWGNADDTPIEPGKVKEKR